ncbi:MULTISPECIES: acyl carrier protein [Kitasatospora]|nr:MULTISPECIES: acyl carrier protein [Kitasatospora]
MSAPAAVEAMLALPEPERLERLRELVVDEFRASLLLEPGEELPLERSFFDLGMTSLRLTELKQRLERRLDCAISANTLFNEPTVAHLVAYLAELVLPREEAPAAPAPVTAEPDGERALVDHLLRDLYQS